MPLSTFSFVMWASEIVKRPISGVSFLNVSGTEERFWLRLYLFKESGIVMKNILVLLFIFILSVSLNAALTVYPNTPNAVVSGVFSVRVNETPIQVRDYMDYHYTHFAFDGSIELTITASEAINTYKISPLSLGAARTGFRRHFDV